MPTHDFYQEFQEEKPTLNLEVELSYRRLHVSDLDLDQIFEDGVAEMDEDLDGTPSSPGTFKQFLQKPDHFYIVGYVNGELAGRVFGTILDHPRGSKSLFIDEIDTLEKYRRKGVAKGLMEELKKLAKEKSIKEMWVGTEVDNRTALALYRSLQPTEDEQFVIFTYEIDNK